MYRGTWQQPSARVRSAGPATPSSLTELAAAGTWRANLDANYLCAPPRPTQLGDAQAVRLDCTRRVGGWPYVAVVALSGGQAWLAEGVVPAVPAVARSVVVLSGRTQGVLVSSAAAAEAYGGALALQEKALGADNPNVAYPAMHLAFQLSIQGSYAEAGYVAALPLDALRARPVGPRGVEAALGDALATPAQRQTRMALSGLVEVRRYQGVVLRELGRVAESEAAVRSAPEVARNGGIERPEVLTRLMRSSALSAFAAAYPASRPLALVGLLRARELVQAGQADAAVEVCRQSVRVLREIRSGFEPERMAGCLGAFFTAAGKAAGTAREGLLREMFQAAQLVRTSATSQQIQQASARLAAGGSGAGDAIRGLQDAAGKLAEVRRRRELAALAAREGAPNPADAKALDEEERAAQAALAGQESTLQAAAPNYGQLVQQAIGAEDVLRALPPHAAFAATTMTADEGWTFLLADGAVRVGRIPGGAGTVDPLVLRVRPSMKADTPARSR